MCSLTGSALYTARGPNGVDTLERVRCASSSFMRLATSLFEVPFAKIFIYHINEIENTGNGWESEHKSLWNADGIMVNQQNDRF